MSSKLLFTVLSGCFLGIVSGTWHNPYPNEIQNLVCRCGEYPNVVSWTFSLSPEKDHPFQAYPLHGVFPFSNGNRYCAKYRNCRECYPNGGLKCKSCSPQKFGKFCEKDCDCQNGGSCKRNGKCSCRYGFKGPKCERLSCDCQNGGSCKRNGKCLCRYGFVGPKCERLKCDCQNGASCNKNGKCLCRYGFKGPKCERLRCGQPSRRTPLIKYGKLTKIGQWPWQALLFVYHYQNNTIWKTMCGGSLLNDLWVMTAAHCLIKSSHADVIPKEDIRVYLGKYFRKISKDDKYVQEREIKEMYIYPKYDNKTWDGDIALVKLKKTVRMTKRVQPVCLPTPETSERNVVDGKQGVVTGWGLNEYSKLTETLEEAAIPVVTGQYCKKIDDSNDGHAYYDVSENMFCAGYVYPNAPDSHSGDSGGPVVFLNPFSHKKRWVIEGIVSWENTVVTENGVHVKIGVYTRVSKFLEWIQSHIWKAQNFSG